MGRAPARQTGDDPHSDRRDEGGHRGLLPGVRRGRRTARCALSASGHLVAVVLHIARDEAGPAAVTRLKFRNPGRDEPHVTPVGWVCEPCRRIARAVSQRRLRPPEPPVEICAEYAAMGEEHIRITDPEADAGPTGWRAI